MTSEVLKESFSFIKNTSCTFVLASGAIYFLVPGNLFVTGYTQLYTETIALIKKRDTAHACLLLSWPLAESYRHIYDNLYGKFTEYLPYFLQIQRKILEERTFI